MTLQTISTKLQQGLETLFRAIKGDEFLQANNRLCDELEHEYEMYRRRNVIKRRGH